MLINFACLFISRSVNLTFELRVFEVDYGRGNYAWNRFRFAVVDANNSKGYPANFVSMLPIRIDSDGKTPSAFTKLFGNESLKIARGLLTRSLKKEQGSAIKAEIVRRLRLLEPNPVIQIKCRVCKKFFETRKEKARKQKFCPECMKRFR